MVVLEVLEGVPDPPLRIRKAVEPRLIFPPQYAHGFSRLFITAKSLTREQPFAVPFVSCLLDDSQRVPCMLQQCCPPLTVDIAHLWSAQQSSAWPVDFVPLPCVCGLLRLDTSPPLLPPVLTQLLSASRKLEFQLINLHSGTSSFTLNGCLSETGKVCSLWLKGAGATALLALMPSYPGLRGGGVFSPLFPLYAVVPDNPRWPTLAFTREQSFFLDRRRWRAQDLVTSLLDCRRWRVQDLVTSFLDCRYFLWRCVSDLAITFLDCRCWRVQDLVTSFLCCRRWRVQDLVTSFLDCRYSLWRCVSDLAITFLDRRCWWAQDICHHHPRLDTSAQDSLSPPSCRRRWLPGDTFTPLFLFLFHPSSCDLCLSLLCSCGLAWLVDTPLPCYFLLAAALPAFLLPLIHLYPMPSEASQTIALLCLFQSFVVGWWWVSGWWGRLGAIAGRVVAGGGVLSLPPVPDDRTLASCDPLLVGDCTVTQVSPLDACLRWTAQVTVSSFEFLDRCCLRATELSCVCRGCWQALDFVIACKLLDCRRWRAEEFVSFFLPCVLCLSLLCSCGLVWLYNTPLLCDPLLADVLLVLVLPPVHPHPMPSEASYFVVYLRLLRSFAVVWGWVGGWCGCLCATAMWVAAGGGVLSLSLAPDNRTLACCDLRPTGDYAVTSPLDAGPRWAAQDTVTSTVGTLQCRRAARSYRPFADIIGRFCACSRVGGLVRSWSTGDWAVET